MTLIDNNVIITVILPPHNLGQLIREDNAVKNKTYVYTYDNAGNITSKKTYSLTSASVEPSGTPTTTTYGYSTGDWGDLLTSFNGSGITYDTIGNPLTYYGSRSFTWEGRRLVEAATLDAESITFKYNDEGLRTSKTVDGVTTNYYYNGSQLIAEEANGIVILYMYNSTGIVGFRYRNPSYARNVWDTYLYEKNLQGDIVAVYDSNGTKKISYTYDAWGNFTTAYYNGASATNLFNPYTYRGYYYDTDLSLYYLNSRYYDSNTGRFINADDTLYNSMLGYNMFAYCNNNPVNYYDPTGQAAAEIFYGWIVGAGSAAAAEPTPVGEIVLVVGAIIIGGIWLAEELGEIGENSNDKLSEPPKSITEPDNNNETDEENKTSLPTEGDPNSDAELYDKKGLKQRRHYGPDGKAEYDIDFRHSGEKHIFPHKHYWDWTKKMPRGPAIDNIKIF